MSQITVIPDEQPSSPARAPQSWSPVTVIVGVLALAVGFLVGQSGGDSAGQSPAIDLAREVGYALPLDQQPAFVDGVIDEAEVAEAVDRFRECVDEKQVTGFRLDFNGQDGFGMSYSDNMDFQAVQECQTRHFDATYHVWRIQDR